MMGLAIVSGLILGIVAMVFIISLVEKRNVQPYKRKQQDEDKGVTELLARPQKRVNKRFNAHADVITKKNENK